LQQIKGVGYKIALLALQYAFYKVDISVFDITVIAMNVFSPVTKQGILVDLHVQNWAHFLGMIDIASSEDAEYVHVQLQKKLHQDYWELLNTTFGCLGQINANDIIQQQKIIAKFMANYLN